MSEDQLPPAAPAEEIPVTPEVAVTPTGAPDLGKRIVAGVIDSLVAMAVGYVLAMVASSLFYPAYIAVMLLRDSLPFLDGQSIGKKALGLKAVTEAGASLSGNWKDGVVRNVPMVIPIFPIVELIILVINKDKPNGDRRFGDQWAKTKVVAV